jgi:MFS family permease
MRPKVRQRLGIAAVIGCITVVAIGLSLSLLLMNFVLEARDVSGFIIGLITAMGGLATIVVSPVVPTLLRWLGAAPTLIAAIVLMALSFLALYWADPLWLWFGLRFLHGAGLAVVLVVSEFWINALVPSGRRGLILGVYAAVQSLGFAAGPALLASIGSAGFTPFALGTGLMFIALIPALFGARAAPERRATARPAGIALGVFMLSLPSATLAAFVFGAVEGGMNLLPIYGLRLGYGEQVAALLAAAVALGNVALQVPIGFISDKIDRRKVLLTCGAIAFACTALMLVASGNLVPLFVLLVIWGGVVAAIYSAGLARMAAHYKGTELASANAAFVMLYSIGRLVAPSVVGAGIDLWNPHGFAVAMALFLALYVLVMVFRAMVSRRSGN